MRLTILKYLFIAFLSFLAFFPASNVIASDQMFGIWKYTCENGPCRTFMNLKDPKKDMIAVSMTLLHDKEQNKSTILIKLPLGVALPPGIRLYTSDDYHQAIPFQVCDNSGCTSGTLLDKDFEEIIASVKTVKIGFYAYGSQKPAAYQVPIDGFSDALNHLRQ